MQSPEDRDLSKTITRTNRGKGFLAGTFQMGLYGRGFGSVAQNVHDGDTVNVSSNANFAIRFLAIDTPEISYQEPGSDRFLPSNHEVFVELLEAPFCKPGSTTGFSSALVSHIQSRSSATAAENHNRHAKAAEDKLEELIQGDIHDVGADKDSFQFFLAFAYEALDHFGRLLAYVYPNQANVPAAERKESYNQRILEVGLSSPYFIFPNVDPFRAQGSLINAALDAVSPHNILSKAPKLRKARDAVKAARRESIGLFAPGDPLQFDAFELRYLARGTPPTRWIINLGGDEQVLFHPQTYHNIPNAEDRLWVPEAFVSLFEASGWKRGPVPKEHA